ncbi:MAG: hypothetical protein AAF573_10230 [Bacteroidota bacterium]
MNIKYLWLSLILVGILFACKNGDNTNVKTAAAKSSVSPPKQKDLCAQLSTDELRKILSLPNTIELSENFEIIESVQIQSCKKSWDNGESYGEVSLTIPAKAIPDAATAMKTFKRMNAALEKGVKQKGKTETGNEVEFKYRASFQPIDDIGDAAVWQPKKSMFVHAMLQFVSGNQIYTLHVDKNDTSDEDMLKYAKQIAQVILK